MTTQSLQWDPFDRTLHVDPYASWRHLRDHAPVYRNEQYDFYALSRYDDVLAASLDTATFSSAHGITLDQISPEVRAEPNAMIMVDPPRHTSMRRMVNRTFTPRRISQLQDRVRTLTAAYLDPFVGSNGFDFVDDFSKKLPVLVISSLLGFPEEDHDNLREWSDAQLHRDEGSPELGAEGQAALEKLLSYYGAQITLRRLDPRDDIVTDLINTEITEPDGTTRYLDDTELTVFIALVNVAGNETVARLLGWSALVLARFPEQRAKLVANPALIPNAIEELLRFEAPSPVQGRFTTKAASFHGIEIPKGSRVALLTGSAGRDEREYEDPDSFDVERENLRHVSFGHGVHFCLGAALARLESQIALQETLTRFPEWEVDTDNVDFVHTPSVRGPSRVPIRLPSAR
jgi:cytochrome P450